MSENVKLHYTEAGYGTPVVLLRGFPLCGRLWREQQAKLGDLCRVITPDLRGHGESPAPSGIYEMDALARDVLALLDFLSIKKALIVGHSMGGYVALATWRLARDRVLALGLVDSQAAADTEEVRQGRLELAQQVVAEGAEVVASAMLPRLFASELPASDPLFERALRMIVETPRAGIVGSLRGMARRNDESDLLATINVPTLILSGTKDQIIPPAKAQALAASVPNAQLSMIENAGHLPMWEAPEATTSALRSFIMTVVT